MIKGTPDGDFFEDNPNFKYIPECAILIDRHGYIKAGRIMWAVWLMIHPRSDFFGMPEEIKLEKVRDGYLKDPDFVWPTGEIVVNIKKRGRPAKKKPTKKKKDEDDDDFEDDEMGVEFDGEDDSVDLDRMKLIGFRDIDLDFEKPKENVELYEIIQMFPALSMGIQEQDYYRLVRLRGIAMQRAEYLNGKDLAVTIKQLASSTPDLDKMQERYLSWKEKEDRAGGDVQSGWINNQKNLM